MSSHSDYELPSQTDKHSRPQNVSTRNDYQKQAYNRLINIDETKSYQSRIESLALEKGEMNLKRLLHSDESIMEQKLKRKHLEDYQQTLRNTTRSVQMEQAESRVSLTDRLLDKIIPAGYIKVTPKEISRGPSVTVQLYQPPDHQPSVDTNIINEISVEYEGIFLKKEDRKHLSLLVRKSEEDLLDPNERKRFKVMEVILRAKNGTSQVRKKANRWFNSHSSDLGAKAIFSVLLPLMLEPDLEDSERHILLKLTGRAAYQLAHEIRPYTHKLVTAVSPLLIDEQMTLRLEAKDTIAVIARSAGLANIITSLRPDLDNSDEYVRNLTARVLAEVASTLGLVKFFPFVKAVLRSKSSQARHTGIRIIHHICINLGGGNGASILPYLPQIADIIKPGLEDELLPVRTATANTISLLADSVFPHGIEAFDTLLEPLWGGLKNHRGRGLAAFVKAVGSLVSLMAQNSSYEEYTNYYLKELLQVMIREFRSPDEDMKRAILRSLLRLPISRTVLPNYKGQLIQPFFQNFWTRKIALDSSQVCRLVIDTTKVMAKNIGVTVVIESLIPLAKNANESMRQMAVGAVNKIARSFPDAFLELQERSTDTLLDAVLFAFQEQTQLHSVYRSAVTSVCNALQSRIKPHITALLSTILFRMKNKEPEVRLQSADLVSAVAPLLNEFGDNNTQIMNRLILFLYESLGEVYPEVLGSIIGALYACLESLNKEALSSLDNPSISMLLPTMTPILKNRHEKVQENCVKLIGLIACKSAECINAKEWMRICFDLLDMLKSQRKRIRIASNATFGFIANAIGPQDVLATLLNNLRVQERQLRVCTAVAIGIVADTCEPFTVLPALMNEYRMPDKNVQNGILKSLGFMFEYISGAQSKDYIHAVTPLIGNGLTDRDQVHRQTAATVVRHLALNCTGFANDDHIETFTHLMNLVLPNIYEQSPHVIIRIIECLDAIRNIIGPGIFLNYIWAGLFHPARKVRTPFWKVFNAAYVQSCDALVPCYPRFDEVPHSEGTKSYNVDELDIWI